MLCLLVYTIYASQCLSGTILNIPSGTTSIADSQYQKCTTISTLTMPDSVTSIGSSAFDSCTSLKVVTLSRNLISMGKNAFHKTAIQEIVIPDGVSVLKENLFYECKNLKKVTFPKNIKSVMNSCFAMTVIEEFVFPDGLQFIDMGISWGNLKLRRVIIPDSCTTISYSAFGGCSGLQEVTLPKGIKMLNGSVFAQTGLVNFIIPDSVEIIGETCFWQTKIQTISIPPKVIRIDRSAFYQCIYLKSIVFEGNSLKIIGPTVFEKCTSLTNLTFPSSLVNISVDACKECQNLKTVIVQCDLSAFLYIGYSSSFYKCDKLDTLVYESNIPIPRINNFPLHLIRTLIINNSNLESIGDITVGRKLSTIAFVDPSTKFTFSSKLYNDITLNISISSSINGFSENVFENVSIDTFIYCGKSISDNSFLKNSKGFKKVITSSSFRGETIGGVKINEKTDQCTQLIPFEVKYQEESGSEEPEKTNEPEKSSPATASSNNNNQDNSGSSNEENNSSKDGKGKGKGGKIAGGIIGAILILAAIAVIAFFIYKYKIHKSENDSEEQPVELSLV
ncbi:surface antigen BspA-like [Trichomonas vaginalis G3]|uniref:Surface antigen BspA-like n=1 Tax=Trichomonas vaginalis (strain ATCC PRA-98 / G3) TaxID=412133 RepID=A2GDZ7_TRIV3|nr:ribonuclease inhibitor domain-containing protein [Trichomonas vaginalis G3]EAX84622.1 surface antigen BspA-like [Trichomonas vaginalis G3]KAI5535615.1 ribonuclease inhibitor domain-containing protein [Trichomonas vaginalis G3]|eukprot:XP_001297552.1 surface antigen BspA-like [Trichomonas vaginalis G3]